MLKKQSGFTLIELSIVLVIIGFLIAGILAATKMVHESRLRTVITDFRSFYTAYHSFVSKYDQAPGDMNNAYTIWGATNSSCSSSAVCDGNNDGIITQTSSTGNESNLAWAHLGFSQMIPYYFSIPASDTGASQININVPASKISGAGYEMRGGSTLSFPSFAGFQYGASTNAVVLGAQAGVGGQLTDGALKSEDVFFIDAKMDDATFAGATATGGGSGTIMGATGTNGDSVNYCVEPYVGVNSVYHLDDPNKDCLVAFALN